MEKYIFIMLIIELIVKIFKVLLKLHDKFELLHFIRLKDNRKKSLDKNQKCLNN
jgi:hypothetical protein